MFMKKDLETYNKKRMGTKKTRIHNFLWWKNKHDNLLRPVEIWKNKNKTIFIKRRVKKYSKKFHSFSFFT